MNHIFKKACALSLVAAMVITTMAGCGKSNSESDKSSDSGKPASGEKQEISFWSQGTDEPDKSLYDYAVNKYNEENKDSGYVIKRTATQNDQYKQKLVVAMSAGECPDMYAHWSGGPMIEYVKSGLAQPITELMKSSGAQDKLLDAAVAQATYNNEIYAVPMLNNSIAGVFYNKEIYDKVGISEAKTLAELEANCDKLISAGYIPFSLANASKWTGSMYYMYLATRMGGLDPFNAAVDGTGTFEDDCFIFAGKKIQEWVDKGYFPEGVNGLDEDAGQSRELMYTDKAAMQLHGGWMTGTYKADSEEFYSKIGWFPFPAIEGGAKDSSVVVGTIGDQFISFNCTGEKLDEAFKCISYFITDEFSAKVLEAGKIPPVKGVKLEDPILQEMNEAISNASSVQLWYDQYLPNQVAEVHKSESQKLFDKSATPEEVAKAQQDAMSAYIAENKK